MSEHNQAEQTAFVIPPALLLGISGLGLLVTIGVLLAEGSLNIIGWAGLGVGLLSLVAWIFLAPEQLRAILTGRAVSFGGTAVVVTVVLVVALAAIYAVIAQQNWTRDLSATNTFSLSSDARDLVTALSAEANAPDIRVLAFYSQEQAGQRDRAEVLLNDIQTASGGQITYEFLDPNRNPTVLERYEAQPGNLVVLPLNDAGEALDERAEVLPALNQIELLAAVITVSAGGDFRAYFLSTEGSVDIEDATPAGGQVIAQRLRDVFNWQVETVTVADLLREDGLEQAEDGAVLVLAGGRSALTDDQVAAIGDYIENGGSLAVFAGINLEGETSLAAAENFGDMLDEQFGVRINDAIVIDPDLAFQSPLALVVAQYGDQFIMEGINPQTDLLAMELPASIAVADTLPDTVTVTTLAQSTENAYTKSGINFGEELTQADLDFDPETDERGVQTLGISAENSETGARLVIMGSDSLMFNDFLQLEAANFRNTTVALRSLFWAARYEDFVANLPEIPVTQSDTEQPVVATPEQLNTVNLVALFILPFGVLIVGVFMWWNRRDQVTG